jgi:hypothetical protein
MLADEVPQEVAELGLLLTILEWEKPTTETIDQWMEEMYSKEPPLS